MQLFKKPYTIGELMNIDLGRQERAGGCVVELEKTYHQLKPESILDKFRNIFRFNKPLVKAYYVIFKLKVLSNTGNSHSVFVKINPDFNLTNWENNPVEIYCDCADFKYRSAYILNQRGSLFLTDRIRNNLGAALTETPKKGAKTSFLCKHSYAVLTWLISNYTGIMRTI